jgi:hypothetical protein
MSDATDPYSRLEFDFGLDATAFHLASVSVKKLDSSNSATFSITACSKIEVGNFGRYYAILLNNVAGAWAYFDVAASRSYTVDLVNGSGLTVSLYPQKAGDASQPDLNSPLGSTASEGLIAAGVLSAQRYFVSVTQDSASWETVAIKIY